MSSSQFKSTDAKATANRILAFIPAEYANCIVLQPTANEPVMFFNNPAISLAFTFDDLNLPTIHVFNLRRLTIQSVPGTVENIHHWLNVAMLSNIDSLCETFYGHRKVSSYQKLLCKHAFAVWQTGEYRRYSRLADALVLLTTHDYDFKCTQCATGYSYDYDRCRLIFNGRTVEAYYVSSRLPKASTIALETQRLNKQTKRIHECLKLHNVNRQRLTKGSLISATGAGL